MLSKKVLIIASSLRANSNSDALAASFARGAKEAGGETELVSLKGKAIQFCKGCLACQKAQKCPIEDDVREIVQKVKEADILVFATPVYYYGPSGQLKTLLDRLNPLFTADYAFRDVYLLMTAAEDEKATPEGTVKGIQGFVDCFEKSCLKGEVFAGGVNDAGEIEGHPALINAYNMGRDCI